MERLDSEKNCIGQLNQFFRALCSHYKKNGKYPHDTPRYRFKACVRLFQSNQLCAISTCSGLYFANKDIALCAGRKMEHFPFASCHACPCHHFFSYDIIDFNLARMVHHFMRKTNMKGMDKWIGAYSWPVGGKARNLLICKPQIQPRGHTIFIHTISILSINYPDRAYGLESLL